MTNLDLTHARDNAMITPNDQPRIQKSSVGPVEPTSMCVNMIYAPGPITQAERTAAISFIDSVGGLERAKEVLRHMHMPIDAAPPQE